MTHTMATRGEDHTGIVEVCCHGVSFWWDMGRLIHGDELLAALDEEAEQRARKMIAEGYHSGELHYEWVARNGRECHVCGWWKIEVD